jgi:hypothetical protein
VGKRLKWRCGQRIAAVNNLVEAGLERVGENKSGGVATVQRRRYNLNDHRFFNGTIIGTYIYNQKGCNGYGF